MPRVLFASLACTLLLTTRPAARVTPPGSGAPSLAPAAQAYTFPTGAGVLFFYVRPDRMADFEAVVSRLAQVLDTTPDPARRQQAAGWRIFKSTEVARDHAIYLFVFDPAIPGADYDPVKLLGEGLPADAQALYERLKASIVRVERMGLGKLR